QGFDLASPPVEFLGDQQPIRRVVFAEWKVAYPAVRLPFGLTAAKVTFETGGGLIAVLGPLREQLHGDCRDGAGDFIYPFGRAYRLPRKMAVHPFHWVSGIKRQNASKHLVEGDAYGIEIAAGID